MSRKCRSKNNYKEKIIMNQFIKIQASLIPIKMKDCFNGNNVKTGLELFVKDFDKNIFKGILTIYQDDQYYTDILLNGIHNKSLYQLSSYANNEIEIVLKLQKAEKFDLIISENFLIENKTFYIRNEDMITGPHQCVHYTERGQRKRNVDKMKEQIALGKIYIPAKNQHIEPIIYSKAS